MFRILALVVMAAAVIAFSMSVPSVAADKDAKEVTMDGKVVCGKCELKETAKCAVALVVEKDGKKTTYWFDGAAHKKYHGDVCQAVKPATVTGAVSKEGEKNLITVKELKYK